MAFWTNIFTKSLRNKVYCPAKAKFNSKKQIIFSTLAFFLNQLGVKTVSFNQIDIVNIFHVKMWKWNFMKKMTKY